MKKYLLSLIVLLNALCLAQDPTLLRPPKGAPVALIVFEDLQCPKCRKFDTNWFVDGRTVLRPIMGNQNHT